MKENIYELIKIFLALVFGNLIGYYVAKRKFEKKQLEEEKEK